MDQELDQEPKVGDEVYHQGKLNGVIQTVGMRHLDEDGEALYHDVRLEHGAFWAVIWSYSKKRWETLHG